MLLLFFASTDRIAYQDLASLLVNQPGVAERARSFILANPFAALRTATFSLPRPLVTTIPPLSAPIDPDITGSISPHAAVAREEAEPYEPPVQIVNRAAKGDRLVSGSSATARVTATVVPIDAAAGYTDYAAADLEPFELRADVAGTLARSVETIPAAGTITRVSQLFFGADGLELPPVLFEHRAAPEPKVVLASLDPASATEGSTTVAPKGLVTGDEAKPKSPAARLGLAGPARAKAEKCLADAIYFESRGEPEIGQTAVAQVVINRVFSGFYPEDVCGTVYQNAHRYLACQFTFACEGKKLVVNEPDMWEQAKRISREMLDGKLWLAEVGKATHYHAYWVKPDWIREMRKIHRIGVHTFYRPKAWEG
ncbi:MAG: cell wall hydrolase [Xanthobacteraceae bacterium]|nr:cell wall hydrolase [Xanthobacteraceae bacterium]